MRLRARAVLRLLPLCPLLSLGGCVPESQDGSSSGTAYVRRVAELPGESAMLQMEDERYTFEGRLKHFFTDKDPKVRRRAAIAAGRIRDRALAADVKALLADPAPEVRAMAALSAGLLGDDALVPDLEATLQDASPAVRSQALLGRSLLGGTTCPESVRALLRPSAPGEDAAAAAVPGDAALAAARFHDASVADLLAPLLGDASAETRWKAAYALFRLERKGPELAQALRDPDPRVRAFAALGCASTRTTDAVPDLIAALQDEDSGVVGAAAAALGELRDPRAAAPLATLAHDARVRRRFAGIEALVAGGLSTATLTELSTDTDPMVRARAVEGLRRARAGSGILVKAAKDEDWRVRAAAARALADAGDVDTLAKTMQYDADARVVPFVLEGLAKLGYRQLGNVLLKHLADKDPAVRATAARLIGGRKIDTATEQLSASFTAYHKHDEVLAATLSVIDALSREGSSDLTLNPIKQAAMDNNWVLRTRAYTLLEQMGKTEGIEPPKRVMTNRSENYYSSVVQRGDYEHHATIETDKGTLVFRLYPKEAPLTVRFLEDVSGSGFYSDKSFTTLVPALEIGDGDDRGDGLGHFPQWVHDEPHEVRFDKVQLTLARPLGRDSGTSQFLITYLPRPDLDGIATPVGELMKGAEVLDGLGPGSVIKSFTVTAHEFKGQVVVEKVKIEAPVAAAGASGAAAAQPAHAQPATGGPVNTGAIVPFDQVPFNRPPAFLYLGIAAGVMLLIALFPVMLNGEKREDVPAALWLVVLLIVLVAGIYTFGILSGSYFNLLTGEMPGPRTLGKPNPPIMSEESANMASLAALIYIVLELTLLYFLVNGMPFARWLFVFLALLEIALFTTQIASRLTLLSIVSQVGIFLNVAKLWFLLMDRRTKEYLSS